MAEQPQDPDPVVRQLKRDKAPDDLCTCGHPREAHEHYRAGTDCGACGSATCPAFTPVALEQDTAETA